MTTHGRIDLLWQPTVCLDPRHDLWHRKRKRSQTMASSTHDLELYIFSFIFVSFTWVLI